MGSSNRTIFLSACLIIIILFLSGCGLTGDLIDWKGDRGLEDYAYNRNELFAEIRKYIGKNHDDVRKAFGKPTDISSPAWFQGIQYDEEWYYKYDKGIPLFFPDEYSMSFYFNQGKVVEVDAL